MNLSLCAAGQSRQQRTLRLLLAYLAFSVKHYLYHSSFFLLSVAISDDIGAIIIIAVFYSSDLSTISLVVASAGLVVLFALNRMKVSKVGPYLVVGLVVWAAVLKSGVHATLAGFAVAWFIPIAVKNDNSNSLLKKLEHDLHPWVAFAILPVFAFANAGVSLAGVGLEDLTNSTTLGIILGLFLGKQFGIFSASCAGDKNWTYFATCRFKLGSALLGMFALWYWLHYEFFYRVTCLRRHGPIV